MCRKSNAGQGFFEERKRPTKDYTRAITPKSNPFAAPNLAPLLILNQTPMPNADRMSLWQGAQWNVELDQRPHTSAEMHLDDGGLWQVRVRMRDRSSEMSEGAERSVKEGEKGAKRPRTRALVSSKLRAQKALLTGTRNVDGWRRLRRIRRVHSTGAPATMDLTGTCFVG